MEQRIAAGGWRLALAIRGSRFAGRGSSLDDARDDPERSRRVAVRSLRLRLAAGPSNVLGTTLSDQKRLAAS